MRTYDFSPLYRSTVGFDRLFDLLDHRPGVETNWPPYNIEKLGETEYRITMAVAGFAPEEIELVQQENSPLCDRPEARLRRGQALSASRDRDPRV